MIGLDMKPMIVITVGGVLGMGPVIIAKNTHDKESIKS